MTDLTVRWGGWGDFKKWGGDPSNGGMILKWEEEGLIPLYGLCLY